MSSRTPRPPSRRFRVAIPLEELARDHDPPPPPDHGEESYVGQGRLEGRAALVTGGDRGVGRAVAVAFAREGADVAIASTSSESLDALETGGLVRRAGRRAVVLAGDLAWVQECERIVEEAVEQLGRIDILVNHAAFRSQPVERVEQIDDERLRRVFAVNVEAMFHLVRSALPHMGAGGVILNTASVEAYQPSASLLDYAASKGAVVSFTKGLAAELAPRGIRVNAVARCAAQPAALAHLYVYLASEEARCVTGEILRLPDAA